MSMLAADRRVGPALEVRNLSRRFGTVTAVDDVSFTVPGGTFLSLLGPSGSGKTTILRLLGGFESADSGTICIGGRDVSGDPPYKRDIGFVFQRYALFPHLTVAQNVGFSLQQRGIPRAEREARVSEMLEAVGLAECANRYPEQLAGGQQQRIALARALIFRPRILLMDEPLAALDKNLREHLQQQIRSLQRTLGITTVYVTHDQSEALALADHVAVLNRGRIEQLDTPRAVYERPRTEFVATFIAGANLFRGDLIGTHPGRRFLRLADGTLLRFQDNSDGARESGTLTVAVQPERIRINAQEGEAHSMNSLRGRLADALFRGESFEYRIEAAGQEIVVREPNRPGREPLHPASEVTLCWHPSDTIPL